MFLSGTLLNAATVGVGLRLLRVRDVAVADFLPAIVVAPLVVLAARALVPALP